MRKAILILFISFTFFTFAVNVNASTSFSSDTKIMAVDNNSCALLGDPNSPNDIAYYLQKAFEIMKYVGIVLCIVLTIADFAKALFNEEKEMYKPLVKKALTRLFLAALLFFLPAITNSLLELIGVYGTCGIG